MNCLRWQWANRLLNRGTPRQANSGKRNKAHPQLELLEIRDVPTVAAPSFVLNHALGSAAPLASAGPTGYSPTQVRHAYGFDKISLPGGIAADGSGTTIA